MSRRARARATWMVAGLVLARAGAAPAAEVAVLKSTESPSWRPALQALRKAASMHTLTEHTLLGNRLQGQAPVASLRGRAAAVVALGAPAAQLVREELPDLPLVFCMVQDPARAGISSAPHVAGVAFDTPVRNQLAAFRLVQPRAVRVGIIHHPDHTGRHVEEAQKAASLLRMVVSARAVQSERDVPAALRALLAGDQAVDALWIPPDPVLLGDETRRFLLSETLKAGRPVFSFSAALVAEGALASNGPEFESIGQQAGELVNRLLAGERRIDMQMPRAQLVVNTRIAERLGIDIPDEALRMARKF
jgi:putative ABC transport system substrate-binding protein